MPLTLHYVNTSSGGNRARDGPEDGGRTRTTPVSRPDGRPERGRPRRPGRAPSRVRSGRGSGGSRPAERRAGASNEKPASCGVRSSFRALHFRHEATTFSHEWSPPRERGITWSRFSAVAPQYWHVLGVSGEDRPAREGGMGPVRHVHVPAQPDDGWRLDRQMGRVEHQAVADHDVGLLLEHHDDRSPGCHHRERRLRRVQHEGASHARSVATSQELRGYREDTSRRITRV